MKRLLAKGNKLSKYEKAFIKLSQEDRKHFPIKGEKNEKK